ncbi:ABC transporter-like protein [Spiribacter salinus M19-40]|uniref:ABC transporter-like protein n=1 Tax=Spiribacter salinus M19-40 TaxID=1260251 RepID=R4V2M8_9GAMM|nr:thiol reductant ABC exporter subunit CydC [Spiribacter salinus]AGM40249.1 ABC transporter-like protein [Spiribacter salinus M19-40]
MHELMPYLRMLRPYRGRLMVGAALMLATAAAGIGLLALSGWFITATAVTGALLAAGVAARLDIYVPGGGIRAFAVTRTVARYFERIFNHDVVLRLLRDLRGRVFAQLAALPPMAMTRLRSGELLNRLTTDIDRLDGLYLRGLAPPLIAALALMISAALLAIGSPAIALLTLLLLGGIGALIAHRAWHQGRALTQALAQAGADLRANLLDHLRGLAELKAFGSLDHHQARVMAFDRRERAHEARLAQSIATGEAVLHGAVQTVAVAVLLAALTLYSSGAISGPVAVMMPLAVLALLEPLGVLPGAGLHMARARASAERLDAEHNTATSTATDHSTSASGEPTVPPAFTHHAAPAIEMHHVSLIRGAGARVLADLDLTIAAGEHLGIVGVSGGGKSSLAALLSAQLAPDSGTIHIDGVPIAHQDRETLHAHLGYLTQQTDCFSGTVASNLRLADPDADDGRLWSVLEALALAPFVRAQPDGLDTWIGESGVQLSGGQARRIALGRLLLRNPSLVILDEPLSGLDEDTSEQVRIHLERWLKGRTTLILGHNTQALPAVDRRLRLRAGQLHPAD